MINRCKYPYFIAGIFVLCFLNTGFSQKDTVTVLLNGEFNRGDKFLLRYKKDFILSFGYENQYDSIQIIIDNNQGEFEYLDLRIYRKSWTGIDPLFQTIIYDPDREYIHIYHPKINRRKFFEIFYFNTSKSFYLLHDVIKN